MPSLSQHEPDENIAGGGLTYAGTQVYSVHNVAVSTLRHETVSRRRLRILLGMSKMRLGKEGTEVVMMVNHESARPRGSEI